MVSELDTQLEKHYAHLVWFAGVVRGCAGKDILDDGTPLKELTDFTWYIEGEDKLIVSQNWFAGHNGTVEFVDDTAVVVCSSWGKSRQRELPADVAEQLSHYFRNQAANT